MSDKLTFVTSNKAKFSSAQEIFQSFSIDLTWCGVEAAEIQGADCVEIALAKAETLRISVGGPFFVEDGSFHIDALGGFPGVYMKYVLSTLGTAGFLRLMDGIDDRRCCFRSAVVFCDRAGGMKVFESRREGLLVSRRPVPSAVNGWSEIWRILEVEGADGAPPIAFDQISVQQAEEWRRDSALCRLAAWLNQGGT